MGDTVDLELRRWRFIREEGLGMGDSGMGALVLEDLVLEGWGLLSRCVALVQTVSL